MSLIEEVLARVSLQGIVVTLVGGYILFNFARWVDEAVRLRRLGGARAPTYPTIVPFGLSMVHKTVQGAMQNKNLETWRDIFSRTSMRFNVSPSYTAETRVLNRRIIFTADPENIKAILATQFGDYGKGQPFHEEWKPFLGDSIFATDGDKWHASRQLIRPQFVKDRLSDLKCFESHMPKLFRAIAKGGALNGDSDPVNINDNEGMVHDVGDILFRYTLDVATDFLLGHDIKSLTIPEQPFAEAFAQVQYVQSIITRAGPMSGFVPKKSYYQGIKVINEFVNQYIDLALRLSPAELASKTKVDEGYTFLHALAGFTRDRTILRDQLVAVLLAGRDTTASTLSWTLYELGRHPEVVRKLREEILSTVGPTRAPDYKDMKNMKYLQNIMNETLRIYPVVPFNVRLALHDTTLPRGGGPDGSLPVPVLKDTPVGYSTLVMQRRADLYPPVSKDFPPVEEFSPDRWFKWQPKPWQYIPFNGGPRICIGQQFALTEMAYVLCRLFQRFDRIESHMKEMDGGKPMLKADVVLQPGQGVHVAFWRAEGGI